MAAPAYPRGLPCPAAAPLTAAERRILGPDGGPFDARAFERDGRALRSLAFPPMAARASAQFYAWWRDDLVRGGAWFSADWPLPDGEATAEYRFVGPPQKAFLAPHRWVVTAVAEVRLTPAPQAADSASAWNPLDLISASALPIPLALTFGTRIATRHSRHNLFGYEAGVRGTQTHDTSGKWYIELKILSTGNGAIPITQNQNLTFGLVDASQANVASRPPPSPDSDYTRSDCLNWVICFTRFDSAIFRRDFPATALGQVYSSGVQPQPGDVYGFAWDVGTSVVITLNGAAIVTIPFTYTGVMFPYMSAGLTLVNGPDTVGSEESVLICTAAYQFAYPVPTGFAAWG